MKLPFDPIAGRMNWSIIFPTPFECAQHLWDSGQVIDIDNFDAACEWALVDRWVYDQLMAWAKTAQDLDIRDQARLFRVLVQGTPHKGKARTAYRDGLLRLIAQDLVRDYDLPLVQNEAGGNSACAAGVLSRLAGVPSEVTIAKLLTCPRKAMPEI